jgi:multiple sugar transport system substrate-binding protein
MRIRATVLAAALMLAPLGARAADLVVWWDKGFYPDEDAAVAEIVAAFEQKTGKEVELVLQPQEELEVNTVAAVEVARPPDFAFGIIVSNHISKWAYEDRLADLTDAIGAFSDLFDPDALAWVRLLNARTGQRALYALPMGRTTFYVHVWKTLLERAGFTLADIPKEWEAFWSFWCDRVQPAVREAMRRDDIWGSGLNMSGDAGETWLQFSQFVAAYDAEYVAPDGRLVIDDPEIRRRLVEAIDSYTAIYRKGCIPPDAVTWASGRENNQKFLAQTVVMTPNDTLSIPNALKPERPDDYYENAVTIEWPLGPSGQPFPVAGYVVPAMVFKDAGHVATAEEFVRFLVGEGWLAHYLNFSAERFLPAMSALRDQPFWLDPSDPHRMAGVMQMSLRPLAHDYATASGDWRHDRVQTERVWQKAIARIVTEGISPEQAVNEAIARVKRILSE